MANFYQKFESNQKGFTLVELLIVVVIIGILVAIAVPVYSDVQNKAKEQADAANIRIIEGAIQMYLAENKDISDLSIGVLVSEEYLKEEPKSPYNEDKGYVITITGDDYSIEAEK